MFADSLSIDDTNNKEIGRIWQNFKVLKDIKTISPGRIDPFPTGAVAYGYIRRCAAGEIWRPGISGICHVGPSDTLKAKPDVIATDLKALDETCKEVVAMPEAQATDTGAGQNILGTF